MEISFNISQENLIELRKAFQQNLDTAKEVAEAIADSIARIDRALNPKKTMDIPSEHFLGKTYMVTKVNEYGDYTCECPSYKFDRGLDTEGYCKHIRKAKGRGL